MGHKIRELMASEGNLFSGVIEADETYIGGKRAGKATILASDARRFNIELNMNWVQDTSNPADKFTTASGFKK